MQYSNCFGGIMKSLLSFIGILTLLLLSMNGAHASDSNPIATTPVTTDIENTNYSVISFNVNEKIIAGNNYNITLNINTSKRGNLNISLQRNDYKLTFFNKTEVEQGSSEPVINLTFPEYLDEGMYELVTELNGVTVTKSIFVEKSKYNNLKDIIVKIASPYKDIIIKIIILLIVLLASVFFIVVIYYAYKKQLYKLLFVTILIGGITLNVIVIFTGLQTIPFLNLPTYIVISSFLGALAYVFISWSRTGIALLKEDKDIEDAKDTYMKWSSRLIIAPIFGVSIYFGANIIFPTPQLSGQPANSNYAIATLCLFSGFYIKPIMWKARDTVFSVFAPSEKIKDDLNEFGTTDLGKLLGPKMALDLRDKFGYTELKEFSLLNDEKLTEVAKSVNSEFDRMEKWRAIAKLYLEIHAFGKCTASIEEAERLYTGFNIKTLDELNSKIDKLLQDADIGIAKEKLECWKKSLTAIDRPISAQK